MAQRKVWVTHKDGTRQRHVMGSNSVATAGATPPPGPVSLPVGMTSTSSSEGDAYGDQATVLDAQFRTLAEATQPVPAPSIHEGPAGSELLDKLVADQKLIAGWENLKDEPYDGSAGYYAELIRMEQGKRMSLSDAYELDGLDPEEKSGFLSIEQDMSRFEPGSSDMMPEQAKETWAGYKRDEYPRLRRRLDARVSWATTEIERLRPTIEALGKANGPGVSATDAQGKQVDYERVKVYNRHLGVALTRDQKALSQLSQWEKSPNKKTPMSLRNRVRWLAWNLKRRGNTAK